MTTMTDAQEQYIEHEVKIRVHDEHYRRIERDLVDMKAFLYHMDNKFDSQFKWIIGMFITTIIIPVALHFIKVT